MFASGDVKKEAKRGVTIEFRSRNASVAPYVLDFVIRLFANVSQRLIICQCKLVLLPIRR